ncbi:MAG: leucine-rich repeat domain-containing protein [Daejeonella sp.]
MTDKQNDLKQWWDKLSDFWKDILLVHSEMEKEKITYQDVKEIGWHTCFSSYETLSQKKFERLSKQAVNMEEILAISYLWLYAPYQIFDEEEKKQIDALYPLSNLKHLCLNDTNVENISVLENFKKLEEVDLSTTEMEDLKPLESLSLLKEINLLWSQIKDISSLTSLTQLKSLNLGHIPLKDFTPLQGLINLQKLELFGTSFSNTKLLTGMKKLKYLRLDCTKTTDLEPLSSLGDLEYLDICATKIKSIQPLFSLKLKALVCADTKIKKDELSQFRKLNPKCVIEN